MGRYFIEVAYKGTAYSGFQVQQNANTVQAEVESAFQTFHRRKIELTGSSRTDAGVHAYQNFFHFDTAEMIHPHAVYKLNAILPADIVVKRIIEMPPNAHCRFDATSREYLYKIHWFKNPFLNDMSLYYPYKLDWDVLHAAADYIRHQTNFFAFSKTNTQVKNFHCQIFRSEWEIAADHVAYRIEGNRFLRGMVRLLTATLLKLGRGRITWSEFKTYFRGETKCGHSIAAHGLCLIAVNYPADYFPVSN